MRHWKGRQHRLNVVPDGNKIFPDRANPLANYWDSAWEANLRVRDFDVDYVLDLVETVKAEYCTADFQATASTPSAFSRASSATPARESRYAAGH